MTSYSYGGDVPHYTRHGPPPRPPLLNRATTLPTPPHRTGLFFAAATTTVIPDRLRTVDTKRPPAHHHTTTLPADRVCPDQFTALLVLPGFHGGGYVAPWDITQRCARFAFLPVAHHHYPVGGPLHTRDQTGQLVATTSLRDLPLQTFPWTWFWPQLQTDTSCRTLQTAVFFYDVAYTPAAHHTSLPPPCLHGLKPLHTPHLPRASPSQPGLPHTTWRPHYRAFLPAARVLGHTHQQPTPPPHSTTTHRPSPTYRTDIPTCLFCDCAAPGVYTATTPAGSYGYPGGFTPSTGTNSWFTHSRAIRGTVRFHHTGPDHYPRLHHHRPPRFCLVVCYFHHPGFRRQNPGKLWDWWTAPQHGFDRQDSTDRTVLDGLPHYTQAV